jgi:hypothetical protein
VVQLVISAEKQLERAQAFLAGVAGAAEKATARALNRAAQVGREAAISAITERYAVRPADVREKITLTAARHDSLGVTVTARSGSLALGYFPHSPSAAATGGPGKPVLRAEVVRGQTKDVGGAFVAAIGGKPRIMFRTGARSRTGKTSFKSVYTVPIGAMLGVERVREYVEARALEALDKQLDRELDRVLGKAAA